jgi:hypothetical protein
MASTRRAIGENHENRKSEVSCLFMTVVVLLIGAILACGEEKTPPAQEVETARPLK